MTTTNEKRLTALESEHCAIDGPMLICIFCKTEEATTAKVGNQVLVRFAGESFNDFKERAGVLALARRDSPSDGCLILMTR